ncbi:hypothetical protein FO488_03435 [Geobacter sp. FeAm09]|nr:hypothetical protein FO488_03435 [Geobacter sp. FeAm09]
MEKIAIAIAGGRSCAKVELKFNQGGLQNHNATNEEKKLVREVLVPCYEYFCRKKSDITGTVICNIQNGRLATYSKSLVRIPTTTKMVEAYGLAVQRLGGSKAVISSRRMTVDAGSDK